MTEPDLVERIRARCVRVEPKPGQRIGCLEWRGAGHRGKDGKPTHGRIRHEGRLLLPHRVVLEHALGRSLRRLQTDNRLLEADRDNLRGRVDGLLRALDRDKEYWARFEKENK